MTSSSFVSQVEFVIGYTSRGEITHATVNVVLADVRSNQPLLQTHSVKFQVGLKRRRFHPHIRLQASFVVLSRF